MVCRRWAAGGTPHESGLYSLGVGSTTGGVLGSKALGHKVKSSVKAYIPEDEVEACWLVHGLHRQHARGDLSGGAGEQGVG